MALPRETRGRRRRRQRAARTRIPSARPTRAGRAATSRCRSGGGPLRRGVTDGASLLSPGRCLHSRRRFPTNSTWTRESARIWKSAKAWGTYPPSPPPPPPPPDLLHKCAHQKLLESPFDEREVADLRRVITMLEQGGLVLERQSNDRRDLLVDWRLWADSGGIGSYASGVGIGVGVKLPRILPLFKKEEEAGTPAQTSGAARDRIGGGRQQRQKTARPSTWRTRSRWCSRTRSERSRPSA